jgi:hypothetical protein
MSVQGRWHRPGEPIADLCRACKIERGHTVMAVDGEGRVLRVVCGFCGSQHNYRGGDARRAVPERTPAAAGIGESAASVSPRLLSDRERMGGGMTIDPGQDLELLLRRVLREELGLTPALPAEKWRGGMLVLRPGKPGLREKTWPIETFFHKVVMLRNRLRTLEQQINASELPQDVKVRVQAYISGCYGSLTSFNVLFAHEDDQFRGADGD